MLRRIVSKKTILIATAVIVLVASPQVAGASSAAQQKTCSRAENTQGETARLVQAKAAKAKQR
jgi:hypothetical protein